MIQFKDITIEDKDIIQLYTLNSPRMNCDLSFSNLFSWRFLYKTQYTIIDDFLILRFYADGELSYMMPIGRGCPENVLKKMILDAESMQQPFQLLGVCVWMKEDLNKVMPGKFIYTSDRDYADYIYLREDLVNLKGKKYQSKRNHINKFRKTYLNYRYTALTTKLIPACMELEAKWCRDNNCYEQETLVAERKSLTCAFNNFDALGLSGGVLFVEDEIIAFTYGMPVNQQTFDVSIEKADTSIDGAYTMINHEFAKHIPEQYIYINREEDLGLEGLRKAKLSYHPHILLEKCSATLQTNLHHETQNRSTLANML